MNIPKVTIICLVYRSPYILLSFYWNLLRYTPEIADGSVDFYFVANNANRRTRVTLKLFRIRHYLFHYPEISQNEMLKRKIANPAYLTSVYAAYNFGVTLSNTDEVILVNSDMIFSPNWLAILLSANRDKSVISCSLVERNHPKFSTFPGAIQKNFGSTFLFFKRKSWEKFTRTKADFESTNLVQGGPFMPTLFRKSWFEEYGGYHEGNIGDGEDTERVVEYSDIDFFKKLRDRGISHLSASNSFCYHFKEGERETSLGVFLENRIFAKYRKWKTS